MSLLGPDGQPIDLNNPKTRIIGQKFELEELEPFARVDLEQFIQGARDMMKQGVPEHVPAAMPVGHICRLARTMLDYMPVDAEGEVEEGEAE